MRSNPYNIGFCQFSEGYQYIPFQNGITILIFPQQGLIFGLYQVINDIVLIKTPVFLEFMHHPLC